MASPKLFIFSSVVLAVISINIQDVAGKPPSRIVGGDDTEITDYPAMASIRYAKSHICGGAFITKRHVLTAAHCLASINKKTKKLTITPVSLITIGAGSKYSKKPKNIYKSLKFDVHEDYTGEMDSNIHDIAIVTLEDPITVDASQRPIRLPAKYTESGVSGFVAGWGSEEEYGKASEILQRAPMQVITNTACQRHMNDKIHPEHLCALHKYGVGFCDGDSGGPLIVDDTVVGVVSMSNDCGKGYPDIYTRVYTYIDWIIEKTR